MQGILESQTNQVWVFQQFADNTPSIFAWTAAIFIAGFVLVKNAPPAKHYMVCKIVQRTTADVATDVPHVRSETEVRVRFRSGGHIEAAPVPLKSRRISHENPY